MYWNKTIMRINKLIEKISRYFGIINLMDDNKIKSNENQSPVNIGSSNIFSLADKKTEAPKPIFETVVTDEQALQPEEVPSNVGSPEEALKSSPENPFQNPPPPSSDNITKYLIIAGGAILFVVIFVFLIGILFKGKSQTKEVALQYWGLWEESQIYEPLIAQYKQKNPNVKITYQKMSPQEYREKLLARSKNGQGPDIFRFHNTWLPEIKDVVSSIPSSIMSNGEFEKTFYPIHAKDLKDGNYYYGIPLEIDGLVLVYNEGMFKRLGIDTAPSTWQDIIDDVAKIKVTKDSNGQIINSPIALGTVSNVEHFSDIFGLMLVQNGGNIKKLDQPEASGALQSYRKFAEPPNDVWNDSMPNSITAFIQEKVAMIIVPSWEILTIKNTNPDLSIKVVGVPQLPGTKSVAIASYWAEGVSKYSKNQLEAWKFLKFLVEKENLTKLYELESKTRLFGEPYSRRDLGTALIQNQYIGAVIQQAQSDAYISIPLISRTEDNGLNDNIIQYIENAINETIQGTSYSEALRKASEGVKQIFTTYGIK